MNANPEAVERATQPFPQPWTKRSLIAVCALLGLIGLGIYAYAQQRLHGDVVTGMRTVGEGGVVWGLYIVFDIVFVGLAFAGISVASIARIFRLRDMRPFSRLASLMAVVSLAMAGLCVTADLGRPLHGLLNLPRYARTMSPFFGTFTMIIGAGLTASVILLFLAGRADAAICVQRVSPGRRWFYRMWAAGYKDTERERVRHRIASLMLALVIFPLMVVAFSTLGFVFGVQSGRPGWFSALQAPGFVVLAAITGIGMLLMIAAASARWLGLGNALPGRGFIWLSNAMWVLILLFLYFVAVEELTARYAALQAQTKVAAAIDSGVYATAFWSMLGILSLSFVLLFLQFIRRRYSVGLIVAVGALVNIAGFLKRFLIVVPSQTHGTLLPYPEGHYFPSWVEISVVTGLVALGALMILVFVKIFPIVPLQRIGPVRMPHYAVMQPRRRLARLSLFWLTLTSGLTLATAGLLLSARIGTEPYLDPSVPFSPVLFIVGLVVSLLSVVVYETVPPARVLASPQEAAGAEGV